jgi:hypothetical protein
MRNSRDYSVFKSFSATYLGLLGALALFIILMGVIFILLAQHSAQTEAQFNLVSEQRVLSRAAVAEALEAGRGKESAFARLGQTRDRFEQILRNQRSGGGGLAR